MSSHVCTCDDCHPQPFEDVCKYERERDGWKVITDSHYRKVEVLRRELAELREEYERLATAVRVDAFMDTIGKAGAHERGETTP